MKGADERPSGTLAVAAHPQLAHHVLLPALPRFHALYPEVEIDFRTVNRIGDADALTADVLLLHGWPEVPPDYVHRQLGGSRSLIMAAPDYWALHGVPQHPSDLSACATWVPRTMPCTRPWQATARPGTCAATGGRRPRCAGGAEVSR